MYICRLYTKCYPGSDPYSVNLLIKAGYADFHPRPCRVDEEYHTIISREGCDQHLNGVMAQGYWPGVARNLH